MIDMVLFEIALHSYKGVLATTHGRTYAQWIKGGRTEPTARRLLGVALRGATVHLPPLAGRLDPVYVGMVLSRAARVVAEFAGQLPCDWEVLMSFDGVGIKCANLTLGIACDQKRVSADIHVHRVTNRWGYVAAPTPEKTMVALEEKLPKRYWIEINRLLVPFGKHICTGSLPRCSICPVLDMCRQVGVKKHR